MGILRQLSSQLITGAVSPNILGLDWYVTNGHGIPLTGGGTPNLQDIYYAITRSRGTDGFLGTGGGTYLVGNDSALRQILYLLDQAGYSVEWRIDPDLGVRLPLIFGTPFLWSKSIGNFTFQQQLYTNLYMVQLRGDTAVRLLYVKSRTVPCDRWGIHLYGLPLSATKENQYISVMCFVTFHVPEDSLIVRLTQFWLPNIV